MEQTGPPSPQRRILAAVVVARRGSTPRAIVAKRVKDSMFKIEKIDWGGLMCGVRNV